MLPQALNYAELRIQRDLDLEGLYTTNTSYTATAGSNTLTLSLNDFVTIETMVVGTTPLIPTSELKSHNARRQAHRPATLRRAADRGRPRPSEAGGV